MSNWKIDARIALRAYLAGKKKTKNRKFRFDQFISHATTSGAIGDPDHPNNIGALARWAESEKLIEWTNEVHASRNPLSHGSIVKVWSAV